VDLPDRLDVSLRWGHHLNGGITAFSTWSLAKLRQHPNRPRHDHGDQREALGRILRAGGVSWQTTTTWEASTDPDLVTKIRQIWLAATSHPNGPAEARPDPRLRQLRTALASPGRFAGDLVSGRRPDSGSRSGQPRDVGEVTSTGRDPAEEPRLTDVRDEFVRPG
jgi:hypothetical protein